MAVKGKGRRPALNVRSLSRDHTESAIKTLVSIMRDEKAPQSARVKASETLLDRGWGKAPNVLQGDEDGGPIRVENTLLDKIGSLPRVPVAEDEDTVH